MPLYSLLGFPKPSKPTSITLGIMSPEEAAERLPIILEQDGIEH